ncbi:MAG: ribosome assembly factor SBDS [Nanoarchaeota archaeon]
MASVDKAGIVKYKTNGQGFEILVDTDLALSFKSNVQEDIHQILAVQKIFTDARKGIVASDNALRQGFNTLDVLEIAKVIIQNGEVPLTTEHKEKLREQKRKQIIDYIHRNAVEPKTHVAHPPQRIENAIKEAKVHIDEFQDTQKQIQEVVKKIREILPLKFEVKEIEVKIPPEYTHKLHSIFNSFGKKLSEEWQNNGSLVTVIEIPGGLEEEFVNKINGLCHGNVDIKILRIK